MLFLEIATNNKVFIYLFILASYGYSFIAVYFSNTHNFYFFIHIDW